MYKQISLFGNETKSLEGKRPARSVISASRRTDIPAFFYDWLQDALANGFVEVQNPLFPNKKYTVDLRPSLVHTIVLWSKDFNNVLMNPRQLNDYNLYFQYTINNYSKLVEPNVPEYKATLVTLDGLLKRYVPEQFNIRFDPVMISLNGEICPTPDAPDVARLSAFEQLCRDLKALGMDKSHVTTSNLTLYKNVKSKMEKSGIDVIHLDEEKIIGLFTKMSEIAYKHGISLYSCASPLLERVKGISKGHCIDGELLEKLFGGKVKKSKDNGQREACGCTYSRDIGIYNRNINGMKCLHGCKYCYVIDS